MFIVKVPGINALGKTDGCEKTGNAILNALKEIYTNESGKEIDVKSLDLGTHRNTEARPNSTQIELEEIHLDNGNLELTNKLIYKNSFDFFKTKPKTIFLGGDHSISYSTTRAFLDYCQNSGEEPCLIVFDAHPDLMKPVDGKFPTHEEWLRQLIADGFPTQNLLLVGVRNSCKDELDFLKENPIRIITMNQLSDDLQDTCDIIMEFSNNKELYISLDIDIIDPAFAPATGYQEPGGLTSRQFLYLIQRLNKVQTLRAVDIVEINSEKDKQIKGQTVKLGAKILAEFL